MGAIQLSDEVQRLIEAKVAEGRAVSAASFVEEAVLRMVEGDERYEDELGRVVAEGGADFAAGRFIALETPEEFRCLEAEMIASIRGASLPDER